MLNTNRDAERLALARRLKEVINNSGFTKAEIARACDVSPQALTGWLKTGRVGKDSLVLIANKMDIDLGWLVSGFARASDKLHEPSNVTYGPDLQGAFPVISWVQAGSWA